MAYDWINNPVANHAEANSVGIIYRASKTVLKGLARA